MIVKKNRNAMELLCTKSKYGNFKEGKIYKATAYSTIGKSCNYTNFKIVDEDGDLFTISEKLVSNKGPLLFQIVEREQIKDIDEGVER